MSRQLAHQLWGNEGQAVPVFFTESRKSYALPLHGLIARGLRVRGVEASATLLRKKLFGVSVFTSIDPARRVDVTVRAAEQKPGSMFDLADRSLRQAVGDFSFRLIALDPYLRVDSYLVGRSSSPRYRGTIIFPHAAVLGKRTPELVRFDAAGLIDTDPGDPTLAPTLQYEVRAAVAAVK